MPFTGNGSVQPVRAMLRGLGGGAGGALVVVVAGGLVVVVVVVLDSALASRVPDPNEVHKTPSTTSANTR